MMDNKNNPSSVPWSFMINFSVVLPQSSFSVIVMFSLSTACICSFSYWIYDAVMVEKVIAWGVTLWLIKL